MPRFRIRLFLKLRSTSLIYSLIVAFLIPNLKNLTAKLDHSSHTVRVTYIGALLSLLDFHSAQPIVSLNPGNMLPSQQYILKPNVKLQQFSKTIYFTKIARKPHLGHETEIYRNWATTRSIVSWREGFGQS